jgi:hypothetical protein
MYFLLHYKIENPNKKMKTNILLKSCQIMNSILSNKNNWFLNNWPLTPYHIKASSFLLFLLECILQDDILIESKFTQQ